MKKLSTILASIMLALASANVQADVTPVEGEHYVVIKPATAQKQVIEFFSFYCPHCYDYEAKYHFPDKVKTDLPKDVEFVQYHVNYMGGISTDLTKAWSLAMIKGFAGDVKMELFDGVRNGSIKSVKDIKALFAKHGVGESEYDNLVDSFMVKALTAKQERLAEELKVRSVPSFYINESMQMLPEGIAKGVKTNGEYFDKYSELIKALSSK